MNMTWVDVLVTLADTAAGYVLALWLWFRFIWPWLIIRDARRTIDAKLGETKRVRRAMRRSNRQH